MQKFRLLLLTTLIGCAAFFRPDAAPVHVYVIGDSTASPYDGSTFPRTGWAQVLQPFFDKDRVVVLNKARSGRSSKSFYHEAEGWPDVKAQLQSGDYLFIQFGHNDSKPDTARFTDPFTTYQQYLLQYIEEARALGVTPVLMTSIHRNSWESDTLTVQDTHGDYLVAMRQLADSAEVPLIDMAVLTKALYEKYGFKRSSEEIFLNLPAGLYPAYDAGNEDNTHLQESGAYAIANLVAMAISQTADSQLLPLAAGLLPMEELFLEVSPRLGGN